MSDMDMQSALQKATVLVRGKMEAGNAILAPDSSVPVEVNPVYSSFFGLSTMDAGMEKQVNEINDYMGAKTPNELLDALKEIRYKMGDAHPSLDKVHRYIILKKKARELSTASRALEV